MSDLIAVRGDTNVYNVSMIRQGAGVPLAGAKMWFTAKSDPRAGDNVAAISLNSADDATQIVGIDLPHGTFQITLNPADTDDLPNDAYYYDVQVRESDGTITTIQAGVLHIEQDVTATTT